MLFGVRYGATLTNVGMNAAGALSVTAGALTGTACGLLYLVILFYPGHREIKKSVLLKEISFLICTVLFLVAALVATVSCSFHLNTTESNDGLRSQIFTATGSATLSLSPGSDPALRATIISQLTYGHLRRLLSTLRNSVPFELT